MTKARPTSRDFSVWFLRPAHQSAQHHTDTRFPSILHVFHTWESRT